MTTTAPNSTAAGLWVAIPLVAIVFVPLTGKRGRKATGVVMLALIALATMSCGGGLQGSDGGGGGGSAGTKPGNYTVTITATCGTVAHSTAVTLTVTQ